MKNVTLYNEKGEQFTVDNERIIELINNLLQELGMETASTSLSQVAKASIVQAGSRRSGANCNVSYKEEDMDFILKKGERLWCSECERIRTEGFKMDVIVGDGDVAVFECSDPNECEG